MNINVFISYSRVDAKVAQRIKKALEELGVECFMDSKSIELGDNYMKRIEEALSQCSALVIVISPTALKSNWVNFEIGQAIGRGKTILPFLTVPGLELPDYLSNLQHTNKLNDIRNYFNNLVQPPAPLPPPLPLEKTYTKYVRDISVSEIHLLKIQSSGKELYSSFRPSSEGGDFFRLKIDTTPGWIPANNDDRQTYKKTENVIYIVRDPIRAFEIQIGKLRAIRLGGDPGIIVLEGDLALESIKLMYPLMMIEEYEWVRMVLAEISPNPDVLNYIHQNDPNPTVKKLTTRNPYAPDDLKTKGCLFCELTFLNCRIIDLSDTSWIISNDYPFGPFFHYIAMPREPIHSWESIELRHLSGMNLLIKTFLEKERKQNNLHGSAGIRIGFNSSIRHLVRGKAMLSSAGASISHVHKQIWGMAPGSVNLGDHLSDICDAYSRQGIDYLWSYYKALKHAGLILWQDDYVVLYIPMGQISAHELQVMVKRKNTNHYLELTDEEIHSLSTAEFIVTRLFREIGINSFNEIMISRPFDSRTEGFRIIFTYITREIDFAVSELSLLYVVDKQPYDTLNEAKKYIPKIKSKLPVGVWLNDSMP